jgi:cytoskeleton protein RodZ
MTFETFAAELKKQRVASQVSLMDISASTRINMKFLEAIEEGKFNILPQTYVRAFIREYADAIGYNPTEAMKTYDALQRPRSPEKTPDQQSLKKPLNAAQKQQAKANAFSTFIRQNFLFAAFVVVVAVFVVYLVRPTSDSTAAKEIAETPFDKVVQENQATASKQEEPIALPAVTLPSNVDSLKLEMATTDSVWMTITLDGSRTLEYLFPPNRRATWKAKDNFSVTMGNAGGAGFTLNGHDLGTLGKRGAVVRNVPISAANLPKP